MGKRFYIILFVVLCGSLLLLGFSYSKTSGLNDGNIIYEEVNDNYRVIYSNNKLDTKDNKQLDISIINRSSEKRSFFLKLKGDINSYQNVTYTIDDGDKLPLNNGIVALGSLEKMGVNGDFIKRTINLYSESNNVLEYDLNIIDTLDGYLTKEIISNNSTYYDETDNLRYYGESVNNYIKYNDNIYRIIGVIEGKIRIISNPMNEVNYNSSIDKHLSKVDYLASFSNYNDVNENNTDLYKSWINDSNEFWLAEETLNGAYYVSEGKIRLGSKNDYYSIRKVIDLESEVKVIKGNGSIDSPYEVSYDS